MFQPHYYYLMIINTLIIGVVDIYLKFVINQHQLKKLFNIITKHYEYLLNNNKYYYLMTFLSDNINI